MDFLLRVLGLSLKQPCKYAMIDNLNTRKNAKLEVKEYQDHL